MDADPLAGWQSSEAGVSLSVAWADVDRDGDLDALAEAAGVAGGIVAVARSPCRKSTSRRWWTWSWCC